jgi:hypothetical protein
MTTSPRLGFPELAAGQAVPETTVNEENRYLEQGANHFSVKDRDLTSPPGSPADGDRYLVGGTATGGWSGHTNSIAFYMNTAWAFIAVKEGMTFWIEDESVFLVATSSSAFDTFASGNPTESFVIAASDESTALTTGTAKVTFRMPYAFTLTAVRGSLTVAQTSGSIFTVDINEAGTSVLSTKLTIDNTEKTSTTAATAPVISDSSLADDAEISVDIDQIGDGTAKGLKVVLIGHR